MIERAQAQHFEPVRPPASGPHSCGAAPTPKSTARLRTAARSIHDGQLVWIAMISRCNQTRDRITLRRAMTWPSGKRHRRPLHCHDSPDSRWLSFAPPVPGGRGTAHVGTPSRGSSQTCSSHQTANTAMSVNTFSMSALFCLSIEEAPHTLTRTLPNGVRQRHGRCLSTETNGFPQTVDQPRTGRTFLAMPFNGIARRGIELSVQITRNLRKYH
jgi:hypothetical protein